MNPVPVATTPWKIVRGETQSRKWETEITRPSSVRGHNRAGRYHEAQDKNERLARTTLQRPAVSSGQGRRSGTEAQKRKEPARGRGQAFLLGFDAVHEPAIDANLCWLAIQVRGKWKRMHAVASAPRTRIRVRPCREGVNYADPSLARWCASHFPYCLYDFGSCACRLCCFFIHTRSPRVFLNSTPSGFKKTNTT